MTKEQFLKVIKDYQEQDATLERLSDIINFDSLIIDFGFKMFDMIMLTNFNEIQRNWINWWLYDRLPPYGTPNKALDENGEVIDLSTSEKLWNFIQKYE